MTAHKHPRLWIDTEMSTGAMLELNDKHVHYLKNVMRRKTGDFIRVFNGQDGEFLAEITELNKKAGQAEVKDKLKAQPEHTNAIHLFFTPMKKHRMDIVIEKSVELGVSDLHPLITAHSDIHKINEERIHAQIIETAEQCERIDLPTLHPLETLDVAKLKQDNTPLYACVERGDAAPLDQVFKPGPAAFLIGPVGGFNDEEIEALLNNEDITPVSLGPNVLRAETAAIVCLSLALIKSANRHH